MLRKSSCTTHEFLDRKHRFEHWYRDNSIYLIIARCRDRFPAFQSESAKAVFWDRLAQYAALYGFVPWTTSLLDNHYHTIGYLKVGTNLGPMMQKLHGSVAKLVNDLLPTRRVPFFRNGSHYDYFDGRLRDVLQAERTYRYLQGQSVRHGIAEDWRSYPHTKINREKDRAIKRVVQTNAFLEEVPYARYSRGVALATLSSPNEPSLRRKLLVILLKRITPSRRQCTLHRVIQIVLHLDARRRRRILLHAHLPAEQ